MIDESALNYKRGELVEFTLTLGGGAKRCRALVLNTGVLFGRAARQVWIVDMDEATTEQETAWLQKKLLVPETQIHALIPATFIGRETLLRDNPVCFPVQNVGTKYERPAAIVTIAVPVLESAGSATQKDSEMLGTAGGEAS